MTGILDIDVGNTRTKWRCGDAGGSLPAPALPALATAPTRVRAATVLGNEAALASALRGQFGVRPEFARVRARLGGLVCGYREPAKLGVDRWLATLAAWTRVRGAVVVVCLGTAATVDYVTAAGVHLGGYIAPGLRLLREALAAGTAHVRVPTELAGACDGLTARSAGAAKPSAPAAGLAGGPGTDTRSAVRNGTLAMLAAFVNGSASAFRADRAAEDATVFLTGGDAEVLAPLLATPVRHVPGLVLDGLAIALP